MPYLLKIALVQALVIAASMWVGIRFGNGRGWQRGYSAGYAKCITDYFFRRSDESAAHKETIVSS